MTTQVDAPAPATTAPRAVPGRAGFWLALIGIALVPAAVKLLFAPSYPGSDDAFIHLEVIKRLVAGQGWGINPGEPVNLSSSPVFTLVLWGMHGLGLGGIGWAQVFGAACTTGALVLVGLMLTHVTRAPRLILVGVALAAFNVNLWRWNGTVMEATLACLVMAAALWWRYRLVARSAPWTAELVLGVIVGVGVLVRFEFGMLLACLAVDLYLQRRGVRSVIALLAGAVVPMVAWVVAASITFSDPVPTTFYAKASGWHVVNTGVTRSFLLVMGTSCGVALVVALLAFVRIVRREHASGAVAFVRAHLTLVAFPVLLFAFYYLRTEELQSAGRYILPATLLPAMLAIAALERARAGAEAAGPDDAVALPRSWSRGLVGAVAVQVVLTLVLFATTVLPVLTKFNDNYRATMTDVAHFLHRHCEPGDVALIRLDIGVVSYEQDGGCYLADGGALASPELRGLDVEQQIRRTHPRFVVESLGSSRNDLGRRVPGLRLLWSRGFAGHGLSGQDHYVTNIYAVEPEASR